VVWEAAGRVGRRALGRGALFACLLAALAVAPSTAGTLSGGPGKTHVRDGRGTFVPVPDSIPHVDGAYVDSRIVDDLEFIADHFKVYVVEGFAGRLPSGEKVGCPACHVRDSEHKIGLGVDLIPLVKPRCDKTWHGTTRLAEWAEPRQGEPRAPFRWVGYDGDYNHGCGNHLHLSWNHSDHYKKSKPSRWVETFR